MGDVGRTPEEDGGMLVEYAWLTVVVCVVIVGVLAALEAALAQS